MSLSACDRAASVQWAKSIPADTTRAFKLDKILVVPKKSFEFNSLRNSTDDALYLVTCCEYAYFPFGKQTDKASLRNSLLKNFTITKSKLDTFTNEMSLSNPSDDFKQWSDSLELELGTNNKLCLYLDNDPEATTHGYISFGQITTNKVSFSDSIIIGMKTQDFFKKFFDYFPTDLCKKYKVVKFESCIFDVTHFYSFDKGHLRSVLFISTK